MAPNGRTSMRNVQPEKEHLKKSADRARKSRNSGKSFNFRTRGLFCKINAHTDRIHRFKCINFSILQKKHFLEKLGPFSLISLRMLQENAKKSQGSLFTLVHMCSVNVVPVTPSSPPSKPPEQKSGLTGRLTGGHVPEFRLTGRLTVG